MVQGAVPKVGQTTVQVVGATDDEHADARFVYFLVSWSACLFFWIEVTVFNLLLVYLIYCQESMAQSLVELAPKR